jgi:mRNA interferase MazF
MPSSTGYRRGDIVLVSFPFTDLSSSKKRPALGVSPDWFNTTMSDLVLAAMTSQITDEATLVVGEDDCVDGLLQNHLP